MTTGTANQLPIEAEQLHRSLLEQMSDGVYFVDKARNILYWNPAAEDLTGYSAEQVAGSCCGDNILVHVDDAGQCLCTSGCPLEATMRDGQDRQAHVFLHHKSGHRVPVFVRVAPVFDRLGNIIGGIEVFSDDTSRQSYLERIRQLEQTAYVDELTGLANRRYLERSLHAQFSELHRHDAGFGVIIIDVDHFKQFNDTHGHAVGDLVLRTVARTMGHAVRTHDTVGRWGGEEFLVLAPWSSEQSLPALAERLRSLVGRSYVETAGQRLQVTISLGATLAREGDSVESLIARADELMYLSKRNGRDRVSADLA